MTGRSVTIVGASLAGLRAAEELRRQDFDGPITLLGDEPHAPYDRPPLSKQVLAGEWDPGRTELAGPDRLSELGIDLRPGTPATSFDLGTRRLGLADGTSEPVDLMMVATGARCRELPGSDGMAGVHTLRTIDDCSALLADIEGGPTRVAVIGAGFIGSEVAATVRERGVDVTVVEAAAAPLERVLGPEVGGACARLHRDHGIDLRTGVGVTALRGGDRVGSVELADGTSVVADVVVVGIGVVPNTEWLVDSGLGIDDGVLCDETCAAGPDVVAAGDVARWPNSRFGATMRIEHWDNAAEQGAHAARTLLGDPRPFRPIPYFWSDQYDVKIQLAGWVGEADRVEIVTGSVADHKFVALYGQRDRLVGALGFSRPRHVMKYRALIDAGASYAEALAADI